MTLDEAVKKLGYLKDDLEQKTNDTYALACQLGIEALGRLGQLRNHEPQSLSTTWNQIFGNLPSETEE